MAGILDVILKTVSSTHEVVYSGEDVEDCANLLMVFQLEEIIFPRMYWVFEVRFSKL